MQINNKLLQVQQAKKTKFNNDNFGSGLTNSGKMGVMPKRITKTFTANTPEYS